MKDLANTLCFTPNELSIDETAVSTDLISNTINALKESGILMDKDQEKAIIHSLSYRLTLLWGPAGTGKTDTIASYIIARILMKKQLGSINIVIGSNNYGAIDNLLSKVYKKLNYFSSIVTANYYRVKSSSAENFFDQEIPTSSIIDFTPDDKTKVIKMLKDIESAEDICIVAGTWKQLTKIASGRVEWFDICVIDEATQLNTASALAYFTLLKNTANVTIAGDYKQLGTIYAYDNQLESGIYDSIFNFYRNDHNISMKKLNKTYRSNESIASWPRERFYDNIYESHFKNRKVSYTVKVSKKPKEWPEQLIWHDSFLEVVDPDNPIVVIIHNESTSTLSNLFECELIASLNYLLQLSYNNSTDKYWNDCVGIVSPHRAQNSLIRNKLLHNGFINQEEQLSINTVDSFQGKQRETILNSYVVSDSDFIKKEEEFILDSKRFNVTLTRAESKFIMVISSSLVRYLSNNYKVAEEASHLQKFAKQFCSQIIDNITLLHPLEDGSKNHIECQIRMPS